MIHFFIEIILHSQKLHEPIFESVYVFSFYTYVVKTATRSNIS